MKWIKYEYVCGTDTYGAEILAKKRVGYSESNLVIAQTEAYNGEYTIEDDGKEVNNESSYVGNINMNGNRIINLGDPVEETDAVSKKTLSNYVKSVNGMSPNENGSVTVPMVADPPLFANNLSECTDTSKLYVLPDGYIYAYTYAERPVYTNLADPTSVDWLPNKRFSSGNIVDFANNPDVIVTNPIPCKPGDTIRMRGVNMETLISSARPRTYFYNGTSVVTDTAQQDYYPWDVISNGHGTWDNATKTATFRLVNPTTGSAIAWSFDNIRQNLRLASGFTANDVIITVNQEIIEGGVKEYAWINTGHAFVPADYEDRIIALESDSTDHESRLKLLEANESSSSVPSYWLDELETKANDIQVAMETAGRNKSAFLWYTDAHWDAGNSKMSPALLMYLFKNTSMNKTKFGGDIIGDPSELTHDTVKHLYGEWRSRIKDLNQDSVIGNHDNQHKGSNDSAISNIVYSFLFAPEEKSNRVMGGDFYYYVDELCEKTRYLHLDSGRYSLSDDETEFIIDALKNTPAGWHIVVISHIWFQYTSASEPSVGNMNPYMQKALNLFDAYNARESGDITMVSSTKSYDFTSCNGKVEFCIGGHIHIDLDLSSTGGIPVIITASDVNQERSSNETEDSGKLGTTTESAVFGIIADYTNNKVVVVGVGRGTSRDIAIN